VRVDPTRHLLALLLAVGQGSTVATPTGIAGQEYVVAGREAWEAARQTGFEFSPVLPGGPFILTGGRDGVTTELKSCPRAEGACQAEARIVEGVLFVPSPRCAGGCSREHAFQLFGGRPLAAGWSLAMVELAGTRWWWERAPAYGSRDASFAVRLRAAPGRAGRVKLTRITLRGPAGADWRQAFAAGGPEPRRTP
jgi:hypothetical protein